MKEVSTVVAKQSRNNSQQKLTVGLDLGDRNSGWKHGDSGHSAGRTTFPRTAKIALTPTGLLMEGHFAH
jgi:hypothetical protein